MNSKTIEYIRQYKWSNIIAMIVNNHKAPKICTQRCDGKLVVITGATSGIGLHTAHKYASMGADLLCINRNEAKSLELCREIGAKYEVSCSYLIADLSEISQVRKVSMELAAMKRPIDVLIHNAGVYLTTQEYSSDGYDKVLAVHYLASFMINYLLMDKLKTQEHARIIMVGSEGHRFAAWGLHLDDLNFQTHRYTGLGSYGSAKTAQLLSMLRFEECFRGSGVTINTMHPGAVKTDTGQENGRLYRWFKRNFFDRTLKSPLISAEALYYLGISKDVSHTSGKYFNLTTREIPAPPALDMETARRLWDISLKMTGLNQESTEQDTNMMDSSSMNDTHYDTIIVGAGMAGLTAAAYLARAGKKVLLVEKNREAGGLVNSFVKDGFLFDAGVRALESAGIILPMLKDLQIELEVVKSPVSLGIEDRIMHVEGSKSLDEYRDFLKYFYPDSPEEIDQLLTTILRVMKHMDVLYGIENPIFKDMMRDRHYIFSRLLPWLPRFLLTIGKINRMQYPVEEYLESTVQNSSLRDIISQHFFKNTPAFFALSYFSLYLDYFYPRGGVGKLAEAIRDKAVALGVDIKTETTVNKVDVARKTISVEGGASYIYQDLVWAADLKTFYRIAYVPRLPDGFQARYEKTKEKILKHRGGESVFSLFLEVNEPPESFARIANGHFFYTPLRQGLGTTHRADLDALLQGFDQLSRAEVLDWLDRFLRLNTFEISIPVLKDAAAAPDGQTGLIVSFLADYELFKKVQDAGWLQDFIHEIETRLLAILTENVYPMLEDKLIAHFSYSPLDIGRRIASSEGAIVGWAFEKDMPVISSIQHSDRSVLTPLPHIYQAGQWAYSPAGVPMSILTGKLAANKILKT